MKLLLLKHCMPLFTVLSMFIGTHSMAQTSAPVQNLYLDVHHVGPGKVTAAAVAAAHQKDLALEKTYGVHFINYWVDTAGGNIYCLSSAPDTQSIQNTHAKAHGLLANEFHHVSDGQAAAINKGEHFYLDVHSFGPGKVNALAVAGAHKKDLATEGKYGVNFINYWVDEPKGFVYCLSQAKDSSDVIKTHKEAHGLMPESIMEVTPAKQ